ncbi:LOB domain-containing protein 36-like [Populus alba x Populus x berolinensis]|nr:LOB domain-containing protein 36-like [Populus alba x Populus x berolinensis]
MSSSNSPCAACKFLRRKCTQECVFAPYFPPDQPKKFASVHKVFGASNVAKLLNELNAAQREDAVNSLAYEAEERLRDPVYGCVGLISILQQRLKQLQNDLYSAKKELVNYVEGQAMLPMLMQPQHLGNPSSSTVMQHNGMPMMGIPSVGQMGMRTDTHQHHHVHPQQIYEAQQLAAVVAAREQEMLRAYEQQHQHHTQAQRQQEIVRFNGGFDPANSVAATGFNHVNPAAAMSPSLALGTFDNTFQIQPQGEPQPNQLQPELLLQPQSQQQQPQQLLQHPKSESEEGRSALGPSC